MAALPTMRASDAFPWIYRFILTTIEPLLAFGGALQVLIAPSKYTEVMTRDTLAFDPQTSFLYTELAGAWLHFAFIEVVVLRMLDDRRAWTALCVGMMLSDILYCYSCAQAVGGWTNWIKVAHWTAADWTVFVTTAPPVLTRVLILTGVGVKKDVKKLH